MKINKFIDHTLLKAEATEEQIRQACKEAIEYSFATVCVNPYYIPLVSSELKLSDVEPCSVVGFPLGASESKVKAIETELALANGAKEIDMVVNLGALKSGRMDIVSEEIKNIAAVTGDNAILKVIIECCLLEDEEKTAVCRTVLNNGADYVKTSTGFNSGGAMVEDVRLMRQAVGSKMGIKAAGGIKDYHTAIKFIEAGANRIGTSSGVALVKEI